MDLAIDYDDSPEGLPSSLYNEYLPTQSPISSAMGGQTTLPAPEWPTPDAVPPSMVWTTAARPTTLRSNLTAHDAQLLDQEQHSGPAVPISVWIFLAVIVLCILTFLGRHFAGPLDEPDVGEPNPETTQEEETAPAEQQEQLAQPEQLPIELGAPIQAEAPVEPRRPDSDDPFAVWGAKVREAIVPSAEYSAADAGLDPKATMKLSQCEWTKEGWRPKGPKMSDRTISFEAHSGQEPRCLFNGDNSPDSDPDNKASRFPIYPPRTIFDESSAGSVPPPCPRRYSEHDVQRRKQLPARRPALKVDTGAGSNASNAGGLAVRQTSHNYRGPSDSRASDIRRRITSHSDLTATGLAAVLSTDPNDQAYLQSRGVRSVAAIREQAAQLPSSCNGVHGHHEREAGPSCRPIDSGFTASSDGDATVPPQRSRTLPVAPPSLSGRPTDNPDCAVQETTLLPRGLGIASSNAEQSTLASKVDRKGKKRAVSPGPMEQSTSSSSASKPDGPSSNGKRSEKPEGISRRTPQEVTDSTSSCTGTRTSISLFTGRSASTPSSSSAAVSAMPSRGATPRLPSSTAPSPMFAAPLQAGLHPRGSSGSYAAPTDLLRSWNQDRLSQDGRRSTSSSLQQQRYPFDSPADASHNGQEEKKDLQTEGRIHKSLDKDGSA